MYDIQFRRATREDLPAIIAMLADDPLGRQRETPGLPLDPAYLAAFDAIAADPNQFLAVAEEVGVGASGVASGGASGASGGPVVGTLQLTFLPGLSRRGAWRGQIEAVRVAASHRGGGIGGQAILWAVEQCRAHGCTLVQLTTDRTRTEAHRFYEGLGFVASHLGYKRSL